MEIRISTSGMEEQKEFWSVVEGITEENFFEYAYNERLSPSRESVEKLWQVWRASLAAVVAIRVNISAMVEYLDKIGLETVEVDPYKHKSHPELEGRIVIWVCEVINDKEECAFILSTRSGDYRELQLSLSANADNKERVEIYKNAAAVLHKMNATMNLLFETIPQILRRAIVFMLRAAALGATRNRSNPKKCIRDAIAGLAFAETYRSHEADQN